MADAATVLLVEDSPTQAEQIRGILEDAGYSVRTESNGLEAFAALKREPAQVVLSDIVMPVMDGCTLDTPVVLLSSISDPEDVIRGLASGARNLFRRQEALHQFRPASDS